MLNDLIIDKLSERIVRRLRQGNEYALKKIGKVLKEIKDLPPEEAQKLINVFKYGGDYDKIVNKLAKISKLNKRDIDKIFESVAEKEVNFAKQFYEYRNKKFIPYRQNVELKRLVNTIKRLTLNEYTNITKTTALGYGIKTKEGFAVKAIKEVYHDIIDEGVLNIFQGKQTYDDFLENQIDELGYGLKVIYPTTYIDKDGILQHYNKRLDSSVKQLLNDGLSEMHRQVQDEIGKDFESDGVEITVVVNPAPDHEYVQGHQFSTVRPSRNKLSEFEKFQNDEDCVDVKGNKYPAEFEGHDRRSIGQYNCRHLAYSIIIGVNIQQYSDEELKEIIRKNHDGFTFEGKKYSMYEGSQLQRKIETAVRENKDRYMLAKEVDDEKSMLKAKNKISILQDKYNKLNQISGLPDYEERMQVGAYDRLLRKENYIKTHLLDVNNDVSDKTKTRKIKENEILITKEQNKWLDEYYYNAWKDKDNFFLGELKKKRFEEIKQRIESNYKYEDEIIDLSTFEGCEKLLSKVNATLSYGDEIKKMDIRGVEDATRVIYKDVLSCNALLEDSQLNFILLRADELDPITIAEQQGNRVTLHKKKWVNYDSIIEMEKRLQKEGWHVETEEGKEAIGVIEHEIGHRIHSEIALKTSLQNKHQEDFKNLPRNEHGYIPIKEVKAQLIEEPIRRVMKKENLTREQVIYKYISEYGRTHGTLEMFAETFAGSQCGKSNSLSTELINYLKEINEWKDL